MGLWAKQLLFCAFFSWLTGSTTSNNKFIHFSIVGKCIFFLYLTYPVCFHVMETKNCIQYTFLFLFHIKKKNMFYIAKGDLQNLNFRKKKSTICFSFKEIVIFVGGKNEKSSILIKNHLKIIKVGSAPWHYVDLCVNAFIEKERWQSYN